MLYAYSVSLNPFAIYITKPCFQRSDSVRNSTNLLNPFPCRSDFSWGKTQSQMAQDPVNTGHVVSYRIFHSNFSFRESLISIFLYVLTPEGDIRRVPGNQVLGVSFVVVPCRSDFSWGKTQSQMAQDPVNTGHVVSYRIFHSNFSFRESLISIFLYVLTPEGDIRRVPGNQLLGVSFVVVFC